MSSTTSVTRYGRLAQDICGKKLELRVLQSAAGFYLGTADEMGPVSRESNEYWRKQESAEHALIHDHWTQKEL